MTSTFQGSDRLLLVIAAASALACGGDSPAGTVDPEPVNYVRLESDVGDYIGGGQDREYTSENASITVVADGGHLRVSVDGDEWWTGDFVVPGHLTRLEPGTYEGLVRYPFHDPAVGGLSWSGDGRGCNTLSGSFTVDAVIYEEEELTGIDLMFEQHCEGGGPALYGTIHWRAEYDAEPPGPVNPIPSNLWRPSPGSTPGTATWVYLTSESGDWIGGGSTYTYTPQNASISVAASGNHLTVSVSGQTWWTGDFKGMSTIDRLTVGYYPDLQRFPFHNPARGGLDWSGDGRGCNTLEGWFVVDRITYQGNVVTEADLRFEQRCEGGVPALRGAIRWRAPG